MQMKCYQPFEVPGNTITVGLKAGSKYTVQRCVVLSRSYWKYMFEYVYLDVQLNRYKQTGEQTNKQKTRQANRQTNKNQTNKQKPDKQSGELYLEWQC